MAYEPFLFCLERHEVGSRAVFVVVLRGIKLAYEPLLFVFLLGLRAISFASDFVLRGTKLAYEPLLFWACEPLRLRIMLS